jgi:hypothetical protein
VDDEGLAALLADLAPHKGTVGLTDPDDVPDVADDSGIKRGDLFALYYMMDDKMVELGLLPNLELGVHGGVHFGPYRRRFEGLLTGTHADPHHGPAHALYLVILLTHMTLASAVPVLAILLLVRAF